MEVSFSAQLIFPNGQCPMEEKDKAQTVFTTRTGQYKFNKMPFGLCGAPATFQRLMHIILKMDNCLQCLIYLDDVLIFRRTFDEHLERMNTVLQIFRDSGIKLSPKKWNFFQTKLNFLGHEISKEGIFPIKKKLIKL